MTRRTKAQSGFPIGDVPEKTKTKEVGKEKLKTVPLGEKLCWYCGKGKMLPFENCQKCALCGATDTGPIPGVVEEKAAV